MANLAGLSRTNYFRVKDLDAFKADAKAYGIEFGSWADSSGEVVLDSAESNQPDGAIALFTHDFWPTFDKDTTAMRLDGPRPGPRR